MDVYVCVEERKEERERTLRVGRDEENSITRIHTYTHIYRVCLYDSKVSLRVKLLQQPK